MTNQPIYVGAPSTQEGRKICMNEHAYEDGYDSDGIRVKVYDAILNKGEIGYY